MGAARCYGEIVVAAVGGITSGDVCPNDVDREFWDHLDGVGWEKWRMDSP